MSNRHHLPAGQNMHGMPGGGLPGVDMGGGAGPRGPRRTMPPQQFIPQYQQHGHHQPQHNQYMNPMYNNYGGHHHYMNQPYYGMPPQFQNGMPSPGHMPYQNYSRSPPVMPHYVPMAGVSVPPTYNRPAPQSPSLSTPYQPPPMPAPLPPQTPSSTHSAQMAPPQTPPTPLSREPTSDVTPNTVPSPQSTSSTFRAPLPWLSRPDLDFPERKPRSRRRRKLLTSESADVSLPTEQFVAGQEEAAPAATTTTAEQKEIEGSGAASTPKASKVEPTTTAPEPAALEPAVPAVPATTGLPTTVPVSEAPTQSAQAMAPEAASEETAPEAVPEPPVKAAPTSWANLFAKSSASAKTNQNGSANTNNTGVVGGGASVSRNSSLAEAIQTFQVGSEDKVAFLEPRGLINTGNMCYMNSVLQVLMFCVPFYDFLDQVSKRAGHSFKSETPLVDAMVMFMHEFKTIKSGPSADKLRRNLKSEELEKYGEPFTPEFVYEAIRQLPRFASMRRGHQQDAEEFLGFLLQSLEDECVHVVNNAGQATEDAPTNGAGDGSKDPSDDWLEVGRKQKAAVSRSAGSNTSTPITKMFGGLLRSEFRVPGLKDSITTEPYQPLQLDIGAPDIRNVVDALRGLTRPERIHGDFNSPRGKDVSATKQVFIDTLPPVLILHLKRFQFDAEGNGTVKIWKKVGYPLELEIPREALSRQRRQTMDNKSMPRYRLISVVYHHGKNASGGHYTVDVRRQDGAEWIRLDDTVIRRVRSEDVAEIGSEEEPKDTRKENAAPAVNRFGAINEEDAGDEDGWNKVTGAATGGKRWSSVVNGAGNGSPKAKHFKESIKDNKVAYLLFYQRV